MIPPSGGGDNAARTAPDREGKCQGGKYELCHGTLPFYILCIPGTKMSVTVDYGTFFGDLQLVFHREI